MRFVGLTEIAAFFADWPEQSDGVRAWLAEIKHRRWANAGALAEDFLNVDTSGLPTVIFYLEGGFLRIETLIDFRNDVALLISIQRLAMAPGQSRQTWNAHRDH